MVKYIIRLDDACENHDIAKWSEIEKLLDSYSIKPIVGIVPFNEDDALNYSGKINNFWELIRRWQSKKWLIALHGYNHVCFKLDKKKKQFLPLNDISEFVGLNINEQKEKLVNAIEIFQKNGISPSIFMAPCHSFDMSTLIALRSVTNINNISDGFSFRPYRRYGFNWIPQQLWKFRLLPFGIWTICLHPSSMTSENIKSLSKTLLLHGNKFINPESILQNSNLSEFNLWDFLFDLFYRSLFFIKRYFKNFKKKLNI